MEILKWIKIIIEIILLVTEGWDKREAVKKVSKMFGISQENIWRHGGF